MGINLPVDVSLTVKRVYALLVLSLGLVPIRGVGADGQTPLGAYEAIHERRALDRPGGVTARAVTGAGLVSTTGGGVTVVSNPVAGCALWSWVWKGHEFINRRDYGRLVQSSITAGVIGKNVPNPTEAGDRFTTPELPESARHGAPCVRMQVVANVSPDFPSASATSPVQSTRAVPVEWEPRNFGGSASALVLWRDLLIGKDLALNFRGLGPVAQYTTIVHAPKCPNSECARFNAEIPTGYLTGEFSEQYLYDAATHKQVRLNVAPTGAPVGVFPPSGYGGVIFCTPDHQYAMGVYAVSVQAGGSITMPGGGISVAHFFASDGNGPTAAHTIKWAAHGSGAFDGADSRFNVYLISESFDRVEALMDALFKAGVK